jgi:hypothetical protein
LLTDRQGEERERAAVRMPACSRPDWDRGRRIGRASAVVTPELFFGRLTRPRTARVSKRAEAEACGRAPARSKDSIRLLVLIRLIAVGSSIF